MLSSSHLEIAEQAIWALGNVAGDCAIYRDMILKSGGLHPLIRLIKEAKKKDTIKQKKEYDKWYPTYLIILINV